MNENKPVAWAKRDGTFSFNEQKETDSQGNKWFALYINPTKTLTDEEIQSIAQPFESNYTTYDNQTDTNTAHTKFDQLGFAKAILKAAQEK